MKKKIEKFANEPVVYYLHKNRNFINKLKDSNRKATADEVVSEIKDKIADINKNNLRQLWLSMNSLDPDSFKAKHYAPSFEPGPDQFNPKTYLRQKKDQAVFKRGHKRN